MEQGFFKSLFDVSFSSFVTTKLIRALYVVALVLIAVGYVVIAIVAFTRNGGSEVTINDSGELQKSGGGSSTFGLLWLFVIGPIWAFFWTILTRVFYELIIVIFRIMENTRDQLAIMRGDRPAVPPPAASPEQS